MPNVPGLWRADFRELRLKGPPMAHSPAEWPRRANELSGQREFTALGP